MDVLPVVLPTSYATGRVTDMIIKASDPESTDQDPVRLGGNPRRAFAPGSHAGDWLQPVGQAPSYPIRRCRRDCCKGMVPSRPRVRKTLPIRTGTASSIDTTECLFDTAGTAHGGY